MKALKTRKCPKTDTVLLDYPILAQKCYDEAYDPNFKLKMCRYIFFDYIKILAVGNYLSSIIKPVRLSYNKEMYYLLNYRVQ